MDQMSISFSPDVVMTVSHGARTSYEYKNDNEFIVLNVFPYLNYTRQVKNQMLWGFSKNFRNLLQGENIAFLKNLTTVKPL